MKYIIFLFLSFITSKGYAQGSVQIQSSSTINQMMERFVSSNKSVETIKGWRIQIITTDDRRKMEGAMSKFSSLFPGVKTEWSHVAPYYRVKVGAYEDKLQLMGFLLELKEYFSGVIPVMDEIKKSELVGY